MHDGDYSFGMETGADPSVDAAQLREEVLACHADLRRLLSAVLPLATQASQGDPDAASRLPPVLRRLKDSFEDHDRWEERVLGPWFSGAMRDEHQRLSARLGTLTAACSEADARASAFALEGVLAEMLSSLEAEERYLLSPDVLRQDPDNPTMIDQATD
jgi:hypothetical protein